MGKKYNVFISSFYFHSPRSSSPTARSSSDLEKGQVLQFNKLLLQKVYFQRSAKKRLEEEAQAKRTNRMLIAMVVIFVSLSDSTITYRPYNNIALFTVGEMVIHGENNSPMLVVSRLERVIEVSMWGNIAIGSFSR